MKIEICEQMIQSWLLNIHQCQVVQTNWGISPLRTISQKEVDDAYEFVKEVENTLNSDVLNSETLAALQDSIDVDFAKASFDSEEDTAVNTKKKSNKKIKKLNIVKKSKASQFIRQCEIDVVGIRLDNGIVDRVFLVDSAFHKNGLGYHDVVATVIKKLIRATLVSDIIFGKDVDVTVGFATPECKDTPKKEIEAAVNAYKSILATKYPKVSIELYFNEKFSQDIFEPLFDKTDKLNNDNDLFMRALNLINSANKYITKTVSVPTTPLSASPTSSASFGTPSKPSVPTITYTPSNVDDFKDLLLNSKRAEITWIYSDGTRKVNLWNADKVTVSTNISANIQGRPQWRSYKKDGLCQVLVKIL